MRAPFQIIPWLVLLIPFLILAYFYSSLANDVLIARSFFGNDVIVAPKSLFTVFRVPLIEAVCAAAVEIMRRRFARANLKIQADYYLFWTVLLYTVALKSVMQSIETVSPKDYIDLLYYLTFGVVIGGILAAGIAGRNLFSNFSQLNLKYSRLEILALISLLAAYLGLAFVPVYVFG